MAASSSVCLPASCLPRCGAPLCSPRGAVGFETDEGVGRRADRHTARGIHAHSLARALTAKRLLHRYRELQTWPNPGSSSSGGQLAWRDLAAAESIWTSSRPETVNRPGLDDTPLSRSRESALENGISLVSSVHFVTLAVGLATH
ncbi:hypothetical protein GQ53DRAFT_774376 [Thozetella sp. PMI_491]|nr:hypothetical protein GQ53DRAFT_774376 [Thozetella sp. PMI_491]